MRLIISLFLVASFFTANAQELVFSQPVIVNRSQAQVFPYRTGVLKTHGKAMRNVGRGLTFAGIPMFVAGIAMVSSADEYYYTTRRGPGGTYEDGDPKGAFGSLLTAAGGGLTITGIVLWTKGSKKMRSVREKDLAISQRPKTISLVYRF